MKLNTLLCLPAWLRLACVHAAEPSEYESVFAGNGLDQETLQMICPDYTRHAVLQQYDPHAQCEQC